MDFGIQTGQQHRTYDELLALWRAAEEHGYTAAWVYDHFIPVGGPVDGQTFEAWALLSSLLSRTERIRGGVLISCVAYRHPAVAAKAAATVAHAAPGRVEFSVGSCWNAWEAQAFGIGFPPFRERHERMLEAIEVARAVWSASAFTGTHYRVEEAGTKAEHPLPIWVGGTGARIGEAAARADGWNAVFQTLEEYRGHLARVRRACEEAGRDPASLRLSFGQRVVVAPTVEDARARARSMYESQNVPYDEHVAARVFAGDAATVAGMIAPFRDLGVEQFIAWHEPPFDTADAEQIAAFAETVVPLL